MKKFLLFFAMLAVLMLPAAALAEASDAYEDEYDDGEVYSLYDEQGAYLTCRGGRIYEGDEYISGDDKLYRVTKVDDAAKSATAQLLGDEPPNTPKQTQAVFAALAAAAEGAEKGGSDNQKGDAGKKLICMYSTHSDESYEPSDGTSSKKQDAGIYDVGEALKKNLEEKGIEVKYSEQTHLPHDAGAYRRSRQTAEELLKMQPAALLDLHRDGIPDPDEYTKEIDGEKATKVRLLVGRSNPNADANRAFAKEIKAAADKKYPGMIKDIFIGKGNYNQELYPQALLLEFGTHTISKDRAIASTQFIADVLDDVLFGGSAKAESVETDKAGSKGIAWIIGIVVVGALIYMLAATGTFKGLMAKAGRGASELTGGSMGKKPDDEEKK